MYLSVDWVSSPRDIHGTKLSLDHETRERLYIPLGYKKTWSGEMPPHRDIRGIIPYLPNVIQTAASTFLILDPKNRQVEQHIAEVHS